MKNPKIDPESSSGLDSVSCRTLDVRHEQYQNSNFPNLKRLSNLDFGHLNLFRVSILEIRICR